MNMHRAVVLGHIDHQLRKFGSTQQRTGERINVLRSAYAPAHAGDVQDNDQWKQQRCLLPRGPRGLRRVHVSSQTELLFQLTVLKKCDGGTGIKVVSCF